MEVAPWDSDWRALTSNKNRDKGRRPSRCTSPGTSKHVSVGSDACRSLKLRKVLSGYLPSHGRAGRPRENTLVIVSKPDPTNYFQSPLTSLRPARSASNSRGWTDGEEPWPSRFPSLLLIILKSRSSPGPGVERHPSVCQWRLAPPPRAARTMQVWLLRQSSDYEYSPHLQHLQHLSIVLSSRTRKVLIGIRLESEGKHTPSLLFACHRYYATVRHRRR
ncbi:hypothetical protein B0T11DRAFT_294660 [Plectosphaerella cucumerina]|uniref:Uncharacterized protein n=1 Tax=Plectosphaerella cucumerina TaxID=40658 RepID=A0A8K0THY0_9PEZI|nr:hypothetical protein B0T11DRAFT_294660 [Plectosphaerella cucumerina]